MLSQLDVVVEHVPHEVLHHSLRLQTGYNFIINIFHIFDVTKCKNVKL